MSAELKNTTTTSPSRRWPDDQVRTELMVHWLFLVMAAAVILLSAVMRQEGANAVYLPGLSIPLPETCTSKRLFGYPCPGCGMTRAFIAISHGRPDRAWQFNSASFFLYAFVAIQIPWNAWQIWRLHRHRRPIVLPWVHWLPIAVVVVLILRWITELAVP